MKLDLRLLTLATALLAFSGCKAGKTYTLFYTRTNIGLDADTKPPTAEVGIGRKEGVLQPAFEKGVTPAVVAGISTKQGIAKRFLFGVNSVFAGGKAAVVTASHASQDRKDFKEAVEYKGEQIGATVPGNLLTNGESKRFFFATDTGFGLKTKWDANFVPTAAHIGFNRKEIAWAPVAQWEEKTTDGGKKTNYVNIPAFIATVDHDTSVVSSTDKGNEVSHAQFIATGRAAVLLAKNRDYSRKVLSRVPEFQGALVAAETAAASSLRTWILADQESEAELERRIGLLKTWLTPREGGAPTPDDLEAFVNDNSVAADHRRLKFIKAHPNEKILPE